MGRNNRGGACACARTATAAAIAAAANIGGLACVEIRDAFADQYSDDEEGADEDRDERFGATRREKNHGG